MPRSPKVFADYESVIVEVERITAENADEPISATTLANVHDLLAACRDGIPVPDCLGKGYYSTIWLEWGSVQVEVFEDHLEVYQIKEGQTSISDEEHHPGAVFSHRFLAELFRLCS